MKNSMEFFRLKNISCDWFVPLVWIHLQKENQYVEEMHMLVAIIFIAYSIWSLYKCASMENG